MPQAYRKFMNDLAVAEQQRQFPLGERGHLSHAEADVLIQAWNASLTRTHKIAELFVDRPVCNYCRKQGGMNRLLKILGMHAVTVYELLEPPANSDSFLVEPRG